MDSAAPEHLAGGRPARKGDFILERRHRLVQPHLGRNRSHLVDFGCGNGAQTRWFADDFDCITGLDVSPDSIAEFARTFEDTSVKARGISYDGETIPLDTESADAVISFEVLEHVGDESRALSEIFRILRPGGVLAMSVPNRWWIFETHGAELPLLPWNRVPLFSWLPKPVHDRWARARIYRQREILQLLGEHGFEVQTSARITAPMDVVGSAWLRGALRSTLFASDTTRLPFLSTAILAIAHKPGPAGTG